MTASFWGVNLKGMSGLLSGVFRCCARQGQVSLFLLSENDSGSRCLLENWEEKNLW